MTLHTFLLYSVWLPPILVKKCDCAGGAMEDGCLVRTSPKAAGSLGKMVKMLLKCCAYAAQCKLTDSYLSKSGFDFKDWTFIFDYGWFVISTPVVHHVHAVYIMQTTVFNIKKTV